jgi:hypothetical protein
MMPGSAPAVKVGPGGHPAVGNDRVNELLNPSVVRNGAGETASGSSCHRLTRTQTALPGYRGANSRRMGYLSPSDGHIARTG